MNPATYKLDYFANNKWYSLAEGNQESRIKTFRFNCVTGQKVRIQFTGFKDSPSTAEFGVYNERR